MRSVTLAPIVQVPIDRIVIGERRRERLGPIQRLATSIAARGLIHPILLRGDTLVAGARRLEACRSLKWKSIPARRVERMTEDELRAVELEENTHRENLSDYATSKARLAQIRQAEADLKAKAAEQKLRSTSDHKSRGRGRPKEPESKRTVADETGVSRAERARTEQHVAIAERFPFMQRAGWLRHHVLDAGDVLEQIPQEDRGAIAAIVDQPGIPPPDAIAMLRHAADMTAPQRRDVIARSTSDDEFIRRTASTTLAAVPPPPDPGLLALGDAVEAFKRAAAGCRSPKFKPRVAQLSTETAALRDEFRAYERQERANGNTH